MLHFRTSEGTKRCHTFKERLEHQTLPVRLWRTVNFAGMNALPYFAFFRTKWCCEGLVPFSSTCPIYSLLYPGEISKFKRHEWPSSPASHESILSKLSESPRSRFPVWKARGRYKMTLFHSKLSLGMLKNSGGRMDRGIPNSKVSKRRKKATTTKKRKSGPKRNLKSDLLLRNEPKGRTDGISLFLLSVWKTHIHRMTGEECLRVHYFWTPM